MIFFSFLGEKVLKNFQHIRAQCAHMHAQALQVMHDIRTRTLAVISVVSLV